MQVIGQRRRRWGALGSERTRGEADEPGFVTPEPGPVPASGVPVITPHAHTQDDPPLDESPMCAPPGLAVASVGPEHVMPALAELRPRLSARLRGAPRYASSSALLEIGHSFIAADRSGVDALAEPPGNFPSTLALLSEAMRVLAGGNLCLNNLNIICRAYSPGQGLSMHVDRKEMFEEDVYGVVLANTSDGALVFRRTQRSGEILREYRVDERSGTCFKQRGDARYHWQHGIDPIRYGERVSVTWRWFASSAMQAQAAGSSPAHSTRPSATKSCAG